jgi:hypothetical protein
LEPHIGSRERERERRKRERMCVYFDQSIEVDERESRRRKGKRPRVAE